jgi:AcrR family transcriptional regulator
LNRELVLDAAIELIERDGEGALTMRRLGSSLGVEGMAIYHHFSSRDELLGALGDRLLAPLGELELDGEWRGACRRFARAVRELAVRRPATFRLVGLQPLDSAFSLQAVERLLGVLVTAGFEPGDALGVYRAVVSYARGYALAEVTGFTVDAADAEGRRRLTRLAKGDFPILAGRVKELSRVDPDGAYELGLEALLAGLGDPSSSSAC